MLEQARNEGQSLDRDDLRVSPKADRDRLRNLALDALPEACILDIHLSTRAAQGLETALPSKLRNQSLGKIVILQADPTVILARRARRSNRKDPQDTPQDIAAQQAFNLEFASSLSSQGVVLIDAALPSRDVARRIVAAFEAPI